MRYIPNVLSVVRILLTPLVLLLLTTESLAAQSGAVLLFMAASASDYYDGKIARQMGAHSRLGKFLDPFADKVLVLGTFATLAYLEPRAVPWWAVLLIALRDAMVTGLRTWAESTGRSIRTLPAAKAKTLAQLFFLFCMLVLLMARFLPEPIQSGAYWVLNSPIPFVALMAVVAFTLATGAMYFMRLERVRPPSRSPSERPS